MAWTVRSIAEASARARGAFRQYLPGTDSALKNNTVTVIGKVLAAMAHEFELRMAYLSRQLFLRTATGQFLILHCADVGIFRKPAAAASGRVIGIGVANTVYAGGVRFVSGNVTYISTSPAAASPGGAVEFFVRAEPKGSFTNRDAGGIIALADPILFPGLGSDWTVGDAGLGGGADVEDMEALRERGLHRKRNPPRGGALPDYERIALAVPGVVKAWAVRRPLAPGFLAVFFLFKGRPNLIPSAGDVLVVQAAIDAERLIRIDDSVAVAPTRKPIAITIGGLARDTAEIRAAIETKIDAVLFARGRPGLAGDPFTLSRSWIAEAVSQATGEDQHRLILPADDLALINGEYPVRGETLYVA